MRVVASFQTVTSFIIVFYYSVFIHVKQMEQLKFGCLQVKSAQSFFWCTKYTNLHVFIFTSYLTCSPPNDGQKILMYVLCVQLWQSEFLWANV